jgi:prevent-host-death family protein
MNSMPISEAREQLADLSNRVALRGERIVIERRGKNLCALVPIEDLELLEKLEDRFDLEAIRADKGGKSVPWARVKKELGL